MTTLTMEKPAELTAEERIKTVLRTRQGCRRDMKYLGHSDGSSYYRVNFWRRLEGIVTTHRMADSYFVEVTKDDVRVVE